MPREARPPRAIARPASNFSPQKAPIKIPLNDDREEKAVRFHSRQALHEIQMNQIRAAASPMRKRQSLGSNGSPKTPGMEDQENALGHTLAVVGGNAVTPMKRVPILANFEEWMKMATDNKINAANSWNFALIDYFHDMSLLKEGDGVNFQKASCTLDGCVKIYTSRVDSVATETGKLLSGLADSGNKKRKGDEEEEEQVDGEEEDGEDGSKKRSKKRVQRSSEATLATSFAQLQLKKMELEFSVDPLFKKASADFDEGGAKGLLLNHLTIDAQGRIVFDSSDDAQDPSEDQLDDDSNDTAIEQSRADEESTQPAVNIDMDSLASRFFPDLSRLDEQDICPSLKTFELGGGDASLNLPFLKAPEDWKKDTTPAIDNNEEIQSDNVFDGGMGFDDEDDGGIIQQLDMEGDVGFGEGGEAWARDAAINIQPKVNDGVFDDEMSPDQVESEEQKVGSYEAKSAQYGVALVGDKDFDRENILSYFDQTLQKNWAGPEHWRIRKIKDTTKPAASTTKRREKEPFEIDFMAPLTQAMADMIYTPAASTSAISLPKAQWKSKTRNLLPDDKHFNSRQLLRLFLKPNARIGSRKPVKQSEHQQHNRQQEAPSHDDDDAALPDGEMDEAFWAQRQHHALAASTQETPDDQQPAQPNYDANFFQDDGLSLPPGLEDPNDDDDDNFADAREDFSPGDGEGGDVLKPLALGSIDAMASVVEGGGGSQSDGFGTQLVTQSRRLRPEYVQYARVAKKVDVRRLKEEMWRGIGFDTFPSFPQQPSFSHSSSSSTPQPIRSSSENNDDATAATGGVGEKEDHPPPLRFTTVMNNLQSVYPKQAMADISTSYCFICLLHLANEKGLVLSSEEGFGEIRIERDGDAFGGVGEA